MDCLFHILFLFLYRIFYFIDSLLTPWREGQYSKHFNWQKIEALKPFGGIRIEDNVVIHENNVENMTRDLKLA